MSTPDIQGIQRAVANALHQHWKLYLAEGVILVALGLIAILIPPIATLTVTILLGWLFLISGVMGLATTFWMRQAPGFWWALLSAALGILVGASLLAMPASGAVSLTIVLVFFLHDRRCRLDHVRARSQARIVRPLGLDAERAASSIWCWGAMIFAGLPSTAAWAIGLLVGINMVFGGTALITMALHAKNANPA